MNILFLRKGSTQQYFQAHNYFDIPLGRYIIRFHKRKLQSPIFGKLNRPISDSDILNNAITTHGSLIAGQLKVN